MELQIHILPFYQIDITKWNECITKNDNGFIYASHEYLNALADNWDAIIINDYSSVFPMPWRKKWGIKYYYIPPFTQQLGLIGNADDITKKTIITLITKHCYYGDLLLNFTNNFVTTLTGVVTKNNFTINLNNTHTVLKKNYNSSVIYSLNKAAKAGCVYISSNDIAEIIEWYKTYNKQNLVHVTENNYQQLLNFCKQLNDEQGIILRKVVSQKNELLSVALLLKDTKRYYNLLNYTSPQGRETEANYFLYDSLLNELCEQQMLFDFEGSDLPGVQKFYEKFGATNQPYFYWHINQLPWPIKLLKQ